MTDDATTSQPTAAPASAAPPAGDCAERLGRAPSPPYPERFAVLLNCIDGRTQQPLLDWVRRELDVTYVDVVTEPGIDGVLARGDDAAVQALLNKACVSRLAHGAAALVIAGHHDCAANPGDTAWHVADVARAADIVGRALPELPVRAVYVDETWSVSPLSENDTSGSGTVT